MQFIVIVGCSQAMALLEPLLLMLMPVVLVEIETVRDGKLMLPALPPLMPPPTPMAWGALGVAVCVWPGSVMPWHQSHPCYQRRPARAPEGPGHLGARPVSNLGPARIRA
jgi:hypothetical protein